VMTAIACVAMAIAAAGLGFRDSHAVQLLNRSDRLCRWEQSSSQHMPISQ
jgi:hypothetical protein